MHGHPPLSLMVVRVEFPTLTGPARLARRVIACWWSARADQELAAGRYRGAERCARMARRVATGASRPDDPLLVRLANTLGMIGKYRGRHGAASRAYARAMSVLRGGAPDGRSLATLYHNLGGLEHARGRFARAEVLARHAVALRTRALGARHRDVARDLEAWAAILDGLGRHAEAESAHRRALATLERGLFSPRRDVAATLGNLAACLHAQGRSAEAERVGQRGLAMSRRWLGPAHPETALAAANLAIIRRQRESAPPDPRRPVVAAP